MHREITLTNHIVTTMGRHRIIVEDDIDTGESDGSGTIEVTATSVTPVTARSFQFHGVKITVSGDRQQWPHDSILDEASNMLARDYLEPVGS